MVGWRRLDKVWKCQLIEIWALIKTATGMPQYTAATRLAQTVEHETLNLRVVCSSTTLGGSIGFLSLPNSLSVSSDSLPEFANAGDVGSLYSMALLFLPPHSRGVYVALLVVRAHPGTKEAFPCRSAMCPQTSEFNLRGTCPLTKHSYPPLRAHSFFSCLLSKKDREW